ncbi:hypothetical protein [Thermoanaerobacterium sp. PSU-2]|uniref:hypothetical protein n=1 Tax=Thermoanaerobacterium sp. PSU-2 TaxID=1930849 RepID=UPI00143C2926|nr:hypothetical protein [Thermoanaerobacterium sp. PSU-2]
MEELMEIKKTALELIPGLPDEVTDKLFRICDLVDSLMMARPKIDIDLVKKYEGME